MNLTIESDYKGTNPNVQFVNFNQDVSSLAIGTKTGYQLYALHNCVDNLIKTFQGHEHDDVCIVERLFSSSLVAIVSLSSPRKLRVCHIRRNTEICNYSYTNTILAVRLNRQRLIICLEDQLFIHNLRDMKLIWVINNTPPNPHGLCALSPKSENCYLAYPASSQSGEVQIFDTITLKNKILIPAHDNPLAALTFDQQGLKLASASEKGTVIRVHTIEDGSCIYEFRRGYARCVDIYSLSFSQDSLFLSASSSTETVHIFKLDQSKDHVNSSQSTWTNYLKGVIMQSSTYVSAQVSDMFNQWRSFATCRLPFKQLKNVCAITTIDKQPRVLVVSAEGYLYIYDLNVNEGGDCILIKQHRLEEAELCRDTSIPECISLGANMGLPASSSSSNDPYQYDNEFPPLDQQQQNRVSH